MPGVEGFMYPNEMELQWSILIVLYPYLTGLVAGAFILASLARVFNVKEVQPTYRLALLTALAFLLVALLMEIWLDYRKDIVLLSRSSAGPKKWFYKALTLGSQNISDASRQIDNKVGWLITVIGIPSAFLLHGYVGFIFGSVKANPWWSSPLMPVVFLFSAMVSGIAIVMLLYMLMCRLRRQPIDQLCLDTTAKYLFYTFVIDFSLEMLDLVHRTYEADESFRSLDFMVHTRLWGSQVILQIILGTLVPLALLAANQLWRFSETLRRAMYLVASLLTLVGIFAMR